MKKMMVGICLVVVMLSSSGCIIRPYKKPVILEIEPNQTAFLISLEGDTSNNQAKFASVEFLEKAKVAAKRVELEQRWLQTGRYRNMGKWIPTQRLILVDRTPIARRWTAEADTGTSRSSQSLEAESKDSVGVASGFAITAYIKEEDTAKYLYWYPNKNLASIVDNQIFNACQAIYAQKCSDWEVKDLRHHKEDISEAIRKSVIPQFKVQGITIDPALGLIGGLVYDNPKIQDAIDTVFIAQTMEAKREADRIAQIKQNELDLSIEKNEAEKRKVKADAEAYEIVSKAKAILDGGEAYLELLRLEVEKARIEKWNGEVPLVQSGGEGGSIPVVPITVPTN